MASEDDLKKAQALEVDPEYQKFIALQRRWTIGLTLMAIIGYFSVASVVAFGQDVFTVPFLYWLVFFSAMGLLALSGIYVRVANRRFDPMRHALQKEHGE